MRAVVGTVPAPSRPGSGEVLSVAVVSLRRHRAALDPAIGAALQAVTAVGADGWFSPAGYPPGKLPENRCQAGRVGPPEASMAAPTIPASLRSAAGTMGVRRSSSGRNLSAFLLTPPPTTKRSGQNRFSRVR
jgi:hypothetical protein